MMRISEFITVLKGMFPGVKFFNGTFDNLNKQNIGVYARGAAPRNRAIGPISNTSYSPLPVTILVHWTEDSNLCETMANDLYEKISEYEGTIGGRRVINMQMLDPTPINVGRSEDNVAEMTIRLTIWYERGVL